MSCHAQSRAPLTIERISHVFTVLSGSLYGTEFQAHSKPWTINNRAAVFVARTLSICVLFKLYTLWSAQKACVWAWNKVLVVVVELFNKAMEEIWRNIYIWLWCQACVVANVLLILPFTNISACQKADVIPHPCQIGVRSCTSLFASDALFFFLVLSPLKRSIIYSGTLRGEWSFSFLACFLCYQNNVNETIEH